MMIELNCARQDATNKLKSKQRGTEHAWEASPFNHPCIMLRSLCSPSSRLASRSQITVSPHFRQIYSGETPMALRLRHQITPGHGLLQFHRRTRIVNAVSVSRLPSFHSTPRRQGLHILLTALKVGIHLLSPSRLASNQIVQ